MFSFDIDIVCFFICGNILEIIFFCFCVLFFFAFILDVLSLKQTLIICSIGHLIYFLSLCLKVLI